MQVIKLLLAVLFIFLPPVLISRSGSQHGLLLCTLHTNIAEIGILMLLSRERYFSRGWERRLLLIAFASCLTADIAYALTNDLHLWNTEFVRQILEDGYAVFAILLALYLVSGLKSFGKNYTALAAILVSFAGFSVLSFRYTQTGTGSSVPSLFATCRIYLYTLCMALSASVAAIESFFVKRRTTLFFLQAIVFLFVCDLSIRYAFTHGYHFNAFEYGWEVGISMIFVVFSLQTRELFQLKEIAGLRSLRFYTNLIAACTLLAFALILISLGLIDSNNVFVFTKLSLVLWAMLLISNVFAVELGKQLASITTQLEATADSSDETVGVRYLNKNEGIEEVAVLIDGYNYIAAQFNSKMKQSLAQTRLAALGNLASQVAHDIRSPLSALDSIIKDTAQLPEEKRVIVRSAIGRIRDIANSLLEQHMNAGKPRSADSAGSSPGTSEGRGAYLVSSLLEPLITEKRIQFRSRIDIEIDAHLGTSSYGLFADIQPVEFKRVISNLVNNSVEALSRSGSVIVKLSRSNDKALISVRDTGKGIPPEILPKLGHKGTTYGKTGGSGLGLYHAKKSVEAWGGSLTISSEAGKGTTVSVILPVLQPPDWFVSELKLKPDSTVVIIDDDISIHQVWQGRFDSFRAKEHGIGVLHFSAPEEFRSWVKTNSGAAKAALYLTDYELLGYKETGLSLIEELDIGRQAILVTSRYEETQILNDCLRLKVRMIPKGLAGTVPMSISPLDAQASPARPAPPEAADVVLVDDDPLVHMNWGMAAKKAGKTLKAYKDPEGLFAEVYSLHRSTPIYIDSGLGNGIQGEDIARQLHEHGFTELYLETGHPPERFAHLTFMRKVLGKDPPWEEPMEPAPADD